jgi:hypothetical protein
MLPCMVGRGGNALQISVDCEYFALLLTPLPRAWLFLRAGLAL